MTELSRSHSAITAQVRGSQIRTSLVAVAVAALFLLAAGTTISGCGSSGGGGGGAPAAIPPAVNDDGAATLRSHIVAIAVLANDAGSLALSSLSTPDHGTARILGAVVLYVPDPGYVGSDSFTYTAVDNAGNPLQATVSIEVTAIDSAVEVEGNDTPETATPLARGTSGVGELAEDDDDHWSFTALAGELLTIEIFAGRLAQEIWDADCRLPFLTVLDSAGNPLLGHTSAWSWGSHDLDIPIVEIPSDGTYTIRVRGGDAIGDATSTFTEPAPYALLVSTAPLAGLQKEQEARGTSGSNEFIEDAQPIRPGFLHGQHVQGDFDIYSFEVTAETQVYLELTSYRNGLAGDNAGYYDPALLLYDSDGNFLFYNEDAYFWDPAISFHLNIPGTYYVEVSGFFTDETADYFLQLDLAPVGLSTEIETNSSAVEANAVDYGSTTSGSNEGDLDLFRFTGSAGDVVQVWFFNEENHGVLDPALSIRFVDTDGTTTLASDGPESEEGSLKVLRTVLTAAGEYFVEVSGGTVAIPSIYSIHLERATTSDYESEPNDTTVTATPVGESGRLAGEISDTLDEDIYSFTAVAGELVTIAIHADRGAFSDGFFELSGHGSTLAPGLEIHDDLFSYALTVYEPLLLCVGGESITNGLATLEATFIAPSTGTFNCTVYSQFVLAAEDEGHYWLEVR